MSSKASATRVVKVGGSSPAFRSPEEQNVRASSLDLVRTASGYEPAASKHMITVPEEWSSFTNMVTMKSPINHRSDIDELAAPNRVRMNVSIAEANSRAAEAKAALAAEAERPWTASAAPHFKTLVVQRPQK